MAELTTALLKHDTEYIAEELADVTIYLLGIAEIKGIDLAQAVNEQVNIHELRVYDETGQQHLE